MVQPFLPNKADANVDHQSYPDTVDFAVITRLGNQYPTGVVEGCAVTEDPVTPDMTVDVAAGTVRYDGKPIAVSAQANNTITANSSGNPRIDLITINSAGTVVVTAGTPAAAATVEAPAVPATSVVLAMVYVADSETAIDNVDIVDKRMWVEGNDGVYNIKWYGAAVDGSTDDTTEVQAAIDAANTAGGGVVYHPGGTSVIDSIINVKSNVGIAGVNRLASIFDCDAIATGNCFSLGNLVQRVHIRDLRITAATTTGNALHLDTSVAYSTFERLRIDGNDIAGSKGIYLKGQNWLNTFKDIDIVDFETGVHLANDAAGAGIVVCSFIDVYANSCTTGIDIDNTQRCVFKNCAADNCTDGFRMGISPFASATFIGCQTETNTNGYNIDGSGTWQFINCAAYTSSGSSWVVNSASAKVGWDHCRDFAPTTGSLTLTNIGDYWIRNCTWADGTSPENRIAADLEIHDADNALRMSFTAGGDIVLYDEDGTTARFTWDETATEWVMNSALNLDGDINIDGDVTLTGTRVITSVNPITIRTDSSFIIEQDSPGFENLFQINASGDVIFYKRADTATTLQWDESDDRWEFSKDVDMQGNTIRDMNPAVDYASSPTLDWDDFVVNIDSAAATRTVTLPDCNTYNGKGFLIRRDGTNNVTINRAGSDTFSDAATSKTLGSDGASIGIFSIGDTEWKIVGTNGTVT